VVIANAGRELLFGTGANVASGSPDEHAVLRSFNEFDGYVRIAQRAEQEGQLASAAIYAAVAAGIAANRHCGVFTSHRLESLLNSIGQQITAGETNSETHPSKPIQKVLHVCTETYPIGGVTKMLGLWLRTDRSRRYGLALTQQRGPVPKSLLASIAESSAELHQLNTSVGDCLDWAARLRKLAKRYDAVVLHIHCEDIIAPLAFADTRGMPPVLLLNHADHLFWLGVAISDVIINLRDAAMELSISRRFTEPQRNTIIPTLVESVQRERSRAEAKRALGFGETTTMLVSVARAAKYRSLGDIAYADLISPVLMQAPNAIMVVVGPGKMPDWSHAVAQTDGRIISIEATPDPRLYFEAADIYVDSFPFASSTSMLEAANYCLPLLTLCEGQREPAIFQINHVALARSALRANSIAEFQSLLLRLISDEELRYSWGCSAFEAVRSDHQHPGWLKCLDATFDRARELPKLKWDRTSIDVAGDMPRLGELDLSHQARFGSKFSCVDMEKGFIGMLPLRERYSLWSQLRSENAFDGHVQALKYLFPEWAKRRLKALTAGAKSFVNAV
jgi:hypothetical protein